MRVLRYQLALNGFELDVDGDFFADEDPAGFESDVPGQIKIRAIDFGRCRKSSAGRAPWAFCFARKRDIEGNLAGNAFDGQIAKNRTKVRPTDGNACAFEGNRGMRGGIKQLWARQVPVALFVTGVDAGDIDGDVDRGICRVGFVDVDVAGELFELAADVRNHHVADREGDF